LRVENWERKEIHLARLTFKDDRRSPPGELEEWRAPRGAVVYLITPPAVYWMPWYWSKK